MVRKFQARALLGLGAAAALSSAALLGACDARLGESDGERGEADDALDQNGERDLGSQHASDERYSPLSQITNAEYVASVAHLLGVPIEEVQSNSYVSVLPVEAESQGLVNAANRQVVTQLSISGYAGLSTAVAEQFLDGADAAGFAERLDCAGLAAAAGVAADAYASEACVRDFGEGLLRRGFRGGFEEEDTARLDELMAGLDETLAGVGVVEPDSGELSEALVLRFEAAVQLVALSPKFVLLAERGVFMPEGEARPLTEREVANRLAFFLTGGPPDDALLQEASAGKLSRSDGRVDATDALLSSPESAAGAVDILVRWLGVEESNELVDAASLDQLRVFLEDWVTSERPFEDFYSAPFPVQLVDGLQTEEPFGVLGSRAVVASNTSAPTPSFINRGEFITERLLCAQLPEDLPDAALEEDVRTPLEIFEVHAKEPCATCHHVFDNYGAALQRFDLDTNLYDASANELGTSFELYGIGDVDGTVTGPGDLGATLGASSQAQLCMAKLWYRHAVRRDLLSNAADDDHVQALVEQWASSGDSSLRSLLRTIVADEDFARLLP